MFYSIVNGVLQHFCNEFAFYLFSWQNINERSEVYCSVLIVLQASDVHFPDHVKNICAPQIFQDTLE